MSSDLSLPRSPVFDVKPNILHLDLGPFGLEHIHDYEPDGHHPVHLGHVYGNNGRCRVIHKLGCGGFANVWLCRDTEVKEATKYVALEILMAGTPVRIVPSDGAEFICLSLDHFQIQGPNGDHISFVYPVVGPNISLGLFRASADPDNDLRSLSLQVAKAVKWLHSQGICHGDITPNNILHRISGLDGLNEDEVLQILSSPDVNHVLNASKECYYESTALEYLVYPVSCWDVDAQSISKESCLIDFGESFEISQPPDDLGIPGPYRSPELILDKEAGFGLDIWALGCSLFEIRTGRKLFSSFDDEDNDYLDAIVQVLGKLPEPWWSTTWEHRRRMYKDEVDEHRLAIATLESTPGKDDPRKKESVITSTIHQSVAGNARSLQDSIAPGLWYMSDRHPDGDHHRDISHTELDLFADLLGRLLEYKPEDRISAKDAINHGWFKL